MLEVKIIIEATELANAINNLAAAMGGAKHPISAQTAVPAAQTTAPAAQAAAPATQRLQPLQLLPLLLP